MPSRIKVSHQVSSASLVLGLVVPLNTPAFNGKTNACIPVIVIIVISTDSAHPVLRCHDHQEPSLQLSFAYAEQYHPTALGVLGRGKKSDIIMRCPEEKMLIMLEMMALWEEGCEEATARIKH